MSISCRVTRGDLTESIHVAFAVVVDSSGSPFFATGDHQYVTCARSALKPFQAASIVEAGAFEKAGFVEEELALMCASHNGESIHVDTAKSMLSKLGLTSKDYRCGSHYPYDISSKNMLIKKAESPQPFHNNCSGKHAGMLALARYLSADLSDYLNEEHPVQKTIFEYIKNLINLDEIHIAVDGCTAPTPFLSLQNIATMFQKLADGSKPSLNRVFKAMSNHPQLVGGTGHFDTSFIKSMRGRGITKVGGESVRGIALKTKEHGPLGIAIKILDGNLRAMPIAVMALVEHLELLTNDELKRLDEYRKKILTNHNGIEVGQIEAYIDF